jgi:hypothetical protein
MRRMLVIEFTDDGIHLPVVEDLGQLVCSMLAATGKVHNIESYVTEA